MEYSDKMSIVILSYNRISLLKELLVSLCKINYNQLEIIVTDNHSDDPIREIVRSEFPNVILLEMEKNMGIGARNRGISYATGDIIITLDDDIFGIDENAIYNLIEIFRSEKIGAVCFRVLDAESSKITNWCHHYLAEHYSEETFITNEITEGAVAFRKSTLEQSGLYPESFFISHEGPDLACRIMNKGYNVIYSPEITVKHYHAKSGRKSWRRYYFDTRNILWLVLRNYPFFYGVKCLFIGITAMLIYSVRDSYLKYWAKGLKDGILGSRRAYRERTLMEKRTRDIVRDIERNRPSYFHILKKRVFQKEVRI
jgi:GT2 family glycosyltransferase